jgi:hypothetical protein
MRTGTPKQVSAGGKIADELIEKQKQEQEAKKAELDKIRSEAPEIGTPPVIPATPIQEAPPVNDSRQEQAQPPENKENTPEFWKHKYDTLNGKYKAEVVNKPDVSKYEAEIQRLKKQSEDSLAELERLKQFEPPQKPDLKKYLTPEKIAEYGEDYWENQIMLAEKVADAKIRKLEENFEQKESNNFVGMVKNSIPNFETQNSDPEFIGWLNSTPDGFSGKMLQETLENAFNRKNGEVVRQIFDAFVRQRDAGTRQNPNPQVNLGMVAPHKTPTAPVTGTNKKTYLMSQVRKVYADITKGLIPKDKAQELKREIDLAAMENRIIKD